MPHNCPFCHNDSNNISKFGSFIRRSDKKIIHRFRCIRCLKTFSKATFQQCYRQKKRKLNPQVAELLCSGVSQRRVARVLKINRKTVARKLKFLAQEARRKNWLHLIHSPSVGEMQFDDLETFEHTKCKPLSVTMAVEKHTRRILGFRVSVMPAKGLLAKKSRKKYGPRPDHRPGARDDLFKLLKHKVLPGAEIISDESPHYPRSVNEHFPKAQHKTTKGKRGCVTGQGELKKTGFDPLFSLNHTFAMLRANINRLFRKTWCTTKNLHCLEDHIELYVYYHNHALLKKA